MCLEKCIADIRSGYWLTRVRGLLTEPGPDDSVLSHSHGVTFFDGVAVVTHSHNTGSRL